MAKGTTEKIGARARFVTSLLVFLGFGLVLISLFRWQIVRGEEMKIKALQQSQQSTELAAMRGTIYDATGTKILAQSASVWNVILEPNYLTRGDEKEASEETRRIIAGGLARILDLDEEELYEKTTQKSYYVIIKRKIETDLRDEVNNFLKDNDIGNGVRFEPDYKRYYPYGTVASNVLGFTGNDNNGLEGLELQYEKELSGTAGRMISVKNALGTDMPFEYEQYVGAEDGHSLVLTIDETVQSILEKYLAEGIEKYKIKNGAVAIMMDVNTGAIVGLATKPNYDPNDPFTILDENLLAEIEALPEAERDEAASSALYKQWRNKAVSDTYIPGSVFKMVTGSMGLEENVVTLNDTFVCSGSITVPGWDDPIHCWKHEGHGLEDFAAGIYNSCNPWMIHLGQLIGAEKFCQYRESFGFTTSTGIDLPGEGTNFYHAYESMVPSDLAVESFGQNFTVTPVQMITAASAVANGGNLVRPHLVDRILDSEGNILSTADTTYRRQVISKETSEAITAILQYNTASGTATGGYVAGYRIAGKTGTSEKVDKWNEDPTKDMEYIASYCGYAPADDPKYALLVYFDEPDAAANGGLTGGNAVAGPIFAKIMGEVLPYLGVEARYTDEEYEYVDIAAPSVTGMKLAEAIRTIEDQGLAYSVIGDEDDETAVTEQIPAGGAMIPQDGKVVLYTAGFSEEEGTTEVPDFSGYDLVNASYVAAINGLQISVSGTTGGSAVVTMQSVAAGETVKRGTVISLTFAENVNNEEFVSFH